MGYRVRKCKHSCRITADFGVKTATYQVQVENYTKVEAAVAAFVKDFGRLDVMIANASIPSKASGLDSSIADWDRVRAVDFYGAYYYARAAGLVFKSQVRISRHAANVPQEQSGYNACKASVVCSPISPN